MAPECAKRVTCRQSHSLSSKVATVEPGTAPQVIVTVVRDGEVWLACPHAGAGCVLVCMTRLGERWAQDVIDYHLAHHHGGPWR